MLGAYLVHQLNTLFTVDNVLDVVVDFEIKKTFIEFDSID